MAAPRECRYCHAKMAPLKPGEALRDHECCSDECREEYALTCLLRDDAEPEECEEG